MAPRQLEDDHNPAGTILRGMSRFPVHCEWKMGLYRFRIDRGIPFAASRSKLSFLVRIKGIVPREATGLGDLLHCFRYQYSRQVDAHGSH